MRIIIKTAIFLTVISMLTMGLEACRQSTGNSATTATKSVSEAESKTKPAVTTVDDEGWTFANVPLPEGNTPPRFVSNPDGVLSPEAEDELNRILLYAKVNLNVESCVVAVNHVFEANVETFAYSLFENFKPNNRMLVIVLAYEDKGVRMEIGHDLEAQISEVECQRMLNNILIPYLRENNPDEGLLSLAESIYLKLEEKQK